MNKSFKLKFLLSKAVLISFFLNTLSLSGQDRNDAAWLTWYQFKYQVELRGAWSVTFDNQHRRQDVINFSSQQVLRPGLAYMFKNEVRLSLGTALFWHNIRGKNPIYRFEVRPYTFLEWKQPLGKSTITHRSRFELRYNRKTRGTDILEGYDFNYRAGHKLGISVPVRILRSHDFDLELYDEVLINFGKRIAVNHLDQNRIYLGLKREVSDRLSMKMGYMYVFLPTDNPGVTATQHILVLGMSLVK